MSDGSGTTTTGKEERTTQRSYGTFVAILAVLAAVALVAAYAPAAQAQEQPDDLCCELYGE